MKTLPIGTEFVFFNLATQENVTLRVAKSVKNFSCMGCYFHASERHCPNEYACGKVARTDQTSVIFKKI